MLPREVELTGADEEEIKGSMLVMFIHFLLWKMERNGSMLL